MNKKLAKVIMMGLLCASVLPSVGEAGGCEYEKEVTSQQSSGASMMQIDISNNFTRMNELRADINTGFYSNSTKETNSGSETNTIVVHNGSSTETNNTNETSVDEENKNSNVKSEQRDIRVDPSEVGVWMRGETGESKISSYSFNYNVMSGGYDWHKENDEGILFTGIGFSYGTNDCDDGVIGDSKSYGVNIYGSWYGKAKNEYVDLTLRYGRLDKEYSGLDRSGMYVSGEYEKDMFSIATRYGRRIFEDGWYWEPSLGLIWGRIGSADFVDNLGTDIHANASDSIIASFGMQVGKNIKGIEYYGKAEIMHDFDGKIRVSTPGIVAEDDMGGTWVKCAIGASRKIGQHKSFYFELVRDFGNKVEKPYGVSLGYRFTW